MPARLEVLLFFLILTESLRGNIPVEARRRDARVGVVRGKTPVEARREGARVGEGTKTRGVVTRGVVMTGGCSGTSAIGADATASTAVSEVWKLVR